MTVGCIEWFVDDVFDEAVGDVSLGGVSAGVVLGVEGDGIVAGLADAVADYEGFCPGRGGRRPFRPRISKWSTRRFSNVQKWRQNWASLTSRQRKLVTSIPFTRNMETCPRIPKVGSLDEGMRLWPLQAM